MSPEARRSHPSRRLLLAAGALLVTSIATTLARGQAPVARTIWDGVYSDAQAERGTQPFEQHCATCHSVTPGGNRSLVGKDFMDGFTQKSTADLLTYVSASMPNGRGGTLPETTYNDIVAYMLKANGFPSTTTELTPDTARGVQIVPKDGSGLLPAGALVRVVGCLAPRNGADWTVTNATAPRRTDKAGPDAGDATMALGSGSAPLKFVLTRLDEFVGQRVSVSGFLIGEGGAGGINVSTVSRVAAACP